MISVAGMMVTPDKENPGRCMVHRTVQVDPKGMIPVCVFLFLFVFGFLFSEKIFFFLSFFFLGLGHQFK